MAEDNFIQSVQDATKSTPKSIGWYRDKIREFGKPAPLDLIRDGRRTAKVSAFNLNMFVYDPKYKKTLPYYDTFPLVLPLEPIKGGFMGLNFHYLPYPLRFRLLERMQRFATNAKFDSSTKLLATYDDVKSIRLIRPAIKKYLYNNVKTRFRRIDTDEMAIAVYLPVADFKKAGLGAVFADSRRKI